MFDVVRKAKDAGQNSLKPGMVMGELRDIIVKVVEDAGYHIPQWTSPLYFFNLPHYLPFADRPHKKENPYPANHQIRISSILYTFLG